MDYLLASQQACSFATSPLTIHAQLGHPGLILQKLVSSLSKLSFSHWVESVRKTLVNKQVAFPFALVHSDIWSPSRIITPFGFKCFVTFIDDFTHCMWLFLMRNRSEIFSIFEQFYNEIQTQFWIPIRTLHSYNACQYCQSISKVYGI